MLRQAGHIKNTVALIFRQIQCLYLMSSEVTWVLVSSGPQVQQQIILDPDYLPDYLPVSYDYCVFLLPNAKNHHQQGLAFVHMNVILFAELTVVAYGKAVTKNHW